MGQKGTPPPTYTSGLVNTLMAQQATQQLHRQYLAALNQMQSASSQGRNVFESAYMFGRPIWVWLLWAGRMNYSPATEIRTEEEVCRDLADLAKNNPDEWEAFIAAQRILGRPIPDIGE